MTPIERFSTLLVNVWVVFSVFKSGQQPAKSPAVCRLLTGFVHGDEVAKHASEYVGVGAGFEIATVELDAIVPQQSGTILFSEQRPLVKTINKHGFRPQPDEKMARQADPGHRHVEPLPQEYIQNRQADRDSDAIIQDAVQKTVVGVVILLGVPPKLQGVKQVLVHGAYDLTRSA